MTQKEKRHAKYLKNKEKELAGIKKWQENNKKPCPECSKRIRCRSKFCCSCSRKGIRSYLWKGDKAGYLALHAWVIKNLGKPRICWQCGITTAKRYDWANKSYLYKRELSDWMRLCRGCHRNMDIEKGNGKSLERFPERRKK